MRFNKVFVLLAVATVLQGCGSGGHRAPVVDRTETDKKTAKAPAAAQSKPPREKVSPEKTVPPKVTQEKDWRPQVHIVQKGDTLYSIAFNYGFDYH